MRTPKSLLGSLVLALLLPSPARGAVLQVPADYSSIQAAIIAAANGDTVLVAPGTYVENLDFLGKAIAVVGAQGAEATIIDGGSPVDPFLRGVVAFRSGEGRDSLLEGFTLRNGEGLAFGGASWGGGIACLGSSPTIRGNRITGNTGAAGGGGIYCNGMEGPAGEACRGDRLAECSPLIIDNEISDNQASEAGGGIMCWHASPEVAGNVISGNAALAVSGGGIIAVEGSAPVITGNLFQGNRAHNHGGAVCCLGSPSVIEDNSFIENTALLGGGGVAVFQESETIISGNVFRGNEVFKGQGGGILCYQASPAITGNEIRENRAGSGGGIICSGLSSPPITDNRIAGNRAEGAGGGIVCHDQSSPQIADCSIEGNHSGDAGGGLVLFDRCSAVIVDSSICGNYARVGGGLFAWQSSPRLAHVTLAGNGANLGGGIACVGGAHAAVNSSILWGNHAPVGKEIFLGDPEAPSSLAIRYSDLEGGGGSAHVLPGCLVHWGPGMIDAAPLFAAGLLGDFYLSQAAAGQVAASPCVDAGDPQLPPAAGTNRTDMVPDLERPDMGRHYPFKDGLYLCHRPETLPLTALVWRGAPEVQYLELARCGQGTLAWSVSADAEWLGILPPSGISTGELDRVAVQAATIGLARGEYTATLTLSAPGAINAPESVPVLLTVYDPAVVAGPGPAGENPAQVRLFRPQGEGSPVFEFAAYDGPRFGVNVTCGDLDGDGRDEIVCGAGPGPTCGPHVRGFRMEGTPLPGVSFLAYGTKAYGVNVAAGDLDGDGRAEIVTGAGPGEVYGPHVRAFDWDGGAVAPLAGGGFLAYAAPGQGVNVAAGDLDGDGRAEIVTGAGPGEAFGAHVRAWRLDGGSAQTMPGVSFLAYGPHRFGVQVACGDLDGDGIDEIVTAPGPGPAFGAHVRGWDFDGAGISSLPGCSFLAWPVSQARYGARVHAGADLDQDGRDELVVGAGPDPGAGSPVCVYRYSEEGIALWYSLQAFPAGVTRGTSVAAGRF